VRLDFNQYAEPHKVQFRRRSSAESSGRLGPRVRGALQKLSPARKAETKTDEYVDSGTDVKGPLGLNLLRTVTEPLIDFIFVHGLGGGSRRTWSMSSDPHHYWPREWLPQKPEFRHVRIHSFGYKADWSEMGESVSNIHDFARSLLSEIHCNPDIRKSQVGSKYSVTLYLN